MATTEIPVSDDELDSLMLELEEATGVPAAAPVPKTTPVVASAPSADELEGLDDLDEAPPAATTDPVLSDEDVIVLEDDGTTVVMPAPTPTPLVVAEAAEPNVDDELAALEAEIESGTVAPPATAPWEETTAAITAIETAKETAKARIEPPKNAFETDPLVNLSEPETKSVAAAAPAPKVSMEEEEAAAVARAKKAAAALDYYIDVDKFKADMQVTENNLDDCMMQQASLRAFYGARAARAEAQASSIKTRFEVREAKIYDEHRKALVASGEKATEKAVENMVKIDPRWIAGKQLVIEAESIAAVAKSCVFALSDRKDMIVQLGADRREDSKGQIRTMIREHERNDLRERAMAAAKASNG
jgi:hypothetical protein